MASLCHPWVTTTNLSYRFPIFETSATALCGTTGINKQWKNINIYLYIYLYLNPKCMYNVVFIPQATLCISNQLQGVSLFLNHTAFRSKRGAFNIHQHNILYYCHKQIKYNGQWSLACWPNLALSRQPNHAWTLRCYMVLQLSPICNVNFLHIQVPPHQTPKSPMLLQSHPLNIFKP